MTSAVSSSSLVHVGNSMISVNHPEDVVSFSSEYSENTIQQLRKKGYSGLQYVNGEVLQELLDCQNYIELLKYVWTEENQDKCIEWLNTHALKGHVILMFELSRSLIKLYGMNGPFELVQESFELYFLGLHCTQLDIACCNDDCDSALPFFRKVYGKFFRAHCKDEFYNRLKQIETDAIIQNWVPANDNPAPTWIRFHGMSAMVNRNEMRSQSEWLGLRQQMHDKILTKEELEKKEIN